MQRSLICEVYTVKENIHKSRFPAGLIPTPCSLVGAHKETLKPSEKVRLKTVIYTSYSECCCQFEV